MPGKRIQNQQHPAVRYVPHVPIQIRKILKNTLFPHLAKMYCLMKCPGQFPRSPLFSSHQGPTSQFSSAQSPYTNPPSIIMHICVSYLFRYTLGIIFIIPVLRAYFVNLLDTQYLHQRNAIDEHTFIFFFFFPVC